MKSRVEDVIEVGRAGRKSAHGGWISRGLGNGKGRDQDAADGTGQRVGRTWRRKHGAGHFGGQGKGRVRWIARVGKKKKKGTYGKVERCWRPGPHTHRDGAEIRSQNEDRTEGRVECREARKASRRQGECITGAGWNAM